MALELFDLEHITPNDRRDALDDVASRAPVPFHAEPLSPARHMAFRLASSRVDEMSITETTLSNWKGVRSADRAHDSTEPRLVLVFGDEAAPLRLEQNERMVVGRRASLIPFWSIGAWTLRAEQLQTVRSVTVPLDAVGFPHLLVRDVLARDIGGSPIGRFLAHHLDGLLRLEVLSPAESSAVAQVTIELIRALLSTAVGDEFRTRPSLRRTLGLRIVQHIQSNIGDTELSPESVAGAFGISRRYLYLVMKELDLSFADVVRRARFGRAAELLRDPANAHVAIGVISRASGFCDQSSFSRGFKAEFGQTPSEWRRTVAASPRDPASGASAGEQLSDTVHVLHKTLRLW